MDYMIAIDVGGTFTDCVVRDEAGTVTVGKAFSTPPDFDRGIIDAIATVAASLELTTKTLLESTTLLLHSCTVAENAVFDGKGVRAGLITTSGFEQTLYAMRGGYGRWFGLTEEELKRPVRTDKPPPFMSLEQVKGVRERTDYKGAILVSAKPDEVKQAVQQLLEIGVEALGVCFLWAFANPKNELVAQKAIREAYPDLFLVLSHEVSPKLGEYERMSTVALTAHLGPIVSTYLESLKASIEENGFQGHILVMQAYGGLVPITGIATKVVGTIESGPVAGLKASEFLAAQLGDKDVIATDMGGTSFKAGVMRSGRFDYSREPSVVRYHYAVPKMDIVSIGAGGGSIISVEGLNKTPRVGPKSAGAYPGPICYGHGGIEPTLTDVDLILGYLQPDRFFTGRKKLDHEKALAVFNQKVAEPLGMDALEAASQIYNLANSILYDLLHKITVERGTDPRNSTLVAYGGQAGLHACAYGPKLGVSKVIVPHTAAVFGAFGLAISDVVHDDFISTRVPMPASPKEVNGAFDALEEKIVIQLVREGFSTDTIRVERSLDMRYGRQVHTVVTPIDSQGPITEEDLQRACDRFEALYEQRYGKGSGHRGAGMAVTGYRLRATATLPKPQIREFDAGGSDPSAALLGNKEIYLEGKGSVKANLYDYERFAPGNKIIGPAIVITPITTVLLFPDQQATCDKYRNIVITW